MFGAFRVVEQSVNGQQLRTRAFFFPFALS